MSTDNQNPLSAYFRQSSIFLKLPSGGRYWPAGSIELPASGEVGIMPMTARDEITMRTPDSLMNGSSVVEMISSCVPAIKNPWDIPSIDLDAILIAIRIASYGENMEITATCPKCEVSNEYEIDMRNMLDQIKHIDSEFSVSHGDLVIKLRPNNYKDINDANLETFEEQRMLQLANNTELSEQERMEQFQVLFKKMTNKTVAGIAKNIQSITMPDNNVVSDPAHISEFVHNADRKLFDSIKEHLKNLRENYGAKPVHIVCGEAECDHSFDTNITMDNSNFFA